MRPNDHHVRSFARELKARNLAERTTLSYLEAVRSLRDYLDDADLADITRNDMLGYVADQLDRYAPASAAIRYRSLQQFFKWAALDGVRDDNPMLGMSPPVVPEQPVAVLTLEQVKALLAAVDGKGFEDRRDAAILRLFLEPGGARLSEMVCLRVDDVDLNVDTMKVLGKGRRNRVIPFGSKSGQALERYMRLRVRHPLRREDALWLGRKGPLTVSGVQQMLRRRAAAAGIPHLHPHMLRHTAAHEWLDAGGNETDAMRLFGWRSRQMLERYGASVAVQRAQDSARRLQLGDRY